MQPERLQSDPVITQRVASSAECKIRFAASLKSALQRYAEKTNLHGFVFLAEKQRCRLERISWGLILLGALCFGSYMICLTYGKYLNAPTATSKLPNRIKVSEVEFPAIAICTGNRMSKKAVMQYADLVWTNQRRVDKIVGESIDEIFQTLLLMISLYNFDLDSENWDKLSRLHEFFVAFYGDQYPVEDIMDGFVPKCSDILLKCAISDELDCASIIEFRKTDSGRCCTFNYMRTPEEA
jgi:acid-sensing ion channel, other